jgi:hypothetical protein
MKGINMIKKVLLKLVSIINKHYSILTYDDGYTNGYTKGFCDGSKGGMYINSAGMFISKEGQFTSVLNCDKENN